MNLGGRLGEGEGEERRGEEVGYSGSVERPRDEIGYIYFEPRGAERPWEDGRNLLTKGVTLIITVTYPVNVTPGNLNERLSRAVSCYGTQATNQCGIVSLLYPAVWLWRLKQKKNRVLPPFRTFGQREVPSMQCLVRIEASITTNIMTCGAWTVP